MNLVFPILTLGARSLLSLLLLGVVTPLAAVLLAVVFSKSSPNHTVIGVILLLAVLPSVMIVWSAFARRSVEIYAQDILVKSAFYTAKISKGNILPGLRIVEAENFPGGGVAMRTNGIGLPGYQVGWFVLKNGRSVFLAYTGGQALFVPSNGKFDLVLSVADAQGLLNTLSA